MKAFLGWKVDDKKRAYEEAGARLGWSPPSVEKDLWVTWALAEIFVLPSLQGHLTFKGGTSLSKAWGLIERFSEDIDLTLHRDSLGFGGDHGPDKAPSGKQAQVRLEALKKACRDQVQGVVRQELETSLAPFSASAGLSVEVDATDLDGQTLLLRYKSCFETSGPRYVAAVVKMEFGARSDPWPAADRLVRPRMSEALPKLFDDLGEIKVRALEPIRTFWEKAMLLHEEAHRPAGRALRPRLARHYYDLHCLIEKGVAQAALESQGLFDEVARHRQVYFRHNWLDYSTLQAGRLRLSPAPETESEWKADYRAMQDMLPDDSPSFETLLASAAAFEKSFNKTAEQA